VDLHTSISVDNRETYAFLEGPNKFLSAEKTDKTKRMEHDAWRAALKVPLTRTLGRFVGQMEPVPQTKFLKACQLGIDSGMRISAEAKKVIKNYNTLLTMDAGA